MELLLYVYNAVLFVGETARTKWVHIRDAFSNYRRKMKDVRSGAPGTRIKPYKYAGILEFLLPHLQQREYVHDFHTYLLKYLFYCVFLASLHVFTYT